jgi:hypothetical protein
METAGDAGGEGGAGTFALGTALMGIREGGGYLMMTKLTTTTMTTTMIDMIPTQLV